VEGKVHSKTGETEKNNSVVEEGLHGRGIASRSFEHTNSGDRRGGLRGGYKKNPMKDVGGGGPKAHAPNPGGDLL